MPFALTPTEPSGARAAAPAPGGTPGRRRASALRRLLTSSLAAAALLVPLSLAAPASAATGQITGYGDKCVDVAGGSSADGTRVQLWPCNGSGAQQWDVRADGTIRALGRCLDAAGGGTADGTRVQLWTCNGSGAQRWAVSGARDVVNVQANTCLDATGPSSADRTPLQLWTCSGQPNQKWSAPAVGGGTPPARRLVWSDEFNGAAGTGPDPARWVQEVNGTGGGNAELQHYTAGTQNTAMDGAGNLVITARRATPGQYQCWYGACQYTSGRMTTQGKFTTTYGRVEARIQVPKGEGLWPAFWMLGADIGSAGWPSSGEIDVMENIGREPRVVHGTLHGPGYSGGESIGAPYTIPGGAAVGDAFHTFAVEWSPNRVTWSVDGVEYQTRTPADLGGDRWVYDKPFFLLLNLAVGGQWPGSPTASTPFPAQMRVDYVRVYAPA